MADKTFRPKRGTQATMETLGTVLKAGELFFEYPSTGVGTGQCRIKMGDGSTAYSSLPYAIDLSTVARVSTAGTAVGSSSKPIYVNSSGVATACSSTVGSSTKPVYMSSGTITACGSTVGSSTKPIYMSSGTLTASSSTVGSSSTPVYLSSGTITTTGIDLSTRVSVSTAGTAVGSSSKHIYINSSGVATAASSTIGSSTKPVYLSSGTITAHSSTVGGTAKPIYQSSGTLTACSSTVGSNVRPVYMSSGTIKAGNIEFILNTEAFTHYTGTGTLICSYIGIPSSVGSTVPADDITNYTSIGSASSVLIVVRYTNGNDYKISTTSSYISGNGVEYEITNSSNTLDLYVSTSSCYIATLNTTWSKSTYMEIYIYSGTGYSTSSTSVTYVSGYHYVS